LTPSVILGVVIRSFADRDSERLWQRERVKSLDPRLLRTSLRKLAILDAAVSLDDLRAPPGNRLEALKGARRGQHSIRVNDQWRICFTWTDTGPENVEIVDYH
jgi:proteic killer suppression protein